MAKVLDKPEDPINDLSVLHPEISVTIGGRDLTVREYGFVEGLRLRAKMQPFLDGLRSLTAKPEATPIERVLDIIAEHYDLVIDLIAISADVDREWVIGLGDTDGTTLMFTWWSVNSPFFVRQLQNRWISEVFQPLPNNTSQLSSGEISTEPSLPTDTMPTASDITQSVK